jgi:DNA-binding IclR family transcriptional regulator
VQVVHNALRVLEEVARRQPIGLAELHRRLGLPKTTVHRTLVALAEAGWIRPGPRETGSWALAPRAVVLGAQAADAGGIRTLALPAMERLRDETDECVHLMIPEDGSVVLIERLDSPRAVRTVNPLGTRAPMHASANGKAILARLAAEDVERLFRRPLAGFTEQTITDPGKLRAELDRIRRDGYARNRGEFVREVAAVAAAIVDRKGTPVASLSISAPAMRVSDATAQRFGRLVANAAAEVSAALGHVSEAASEGTTPGHGTSKERPR